MSVMSKSNEEIEQFVELIKNWQKIEDASILNSTDIIKNSDNPLIHLVMEIIRQDSVMHRRVQQLIIDNYNRKPLTLNSEEVKGIWDMVENHNQIEKKTIAMAEESLINIESPIVVYMLNYLLTDEKKHDMLLEELEKIKNSQ